MASHRRRFQPRRQSRPQLRVRPRFETLEERRVLDSTVVFSEIMYRPASSEETLEWLELHNELSINVDLSRWSLAGGVDYAFPQGTIIPSGGYLVVALSPAALQAASGYAGALGPFTGRLSNSGEKLELKDNSGRVMDSVTYADSGAWTAGPDGSGASLVKIDPESASDLPANWTFSPQTGGTPGTRNFPTSTPQYVDTTPVAIDATWRFDDTGVDRGTEWRDAGYNDSGWASGAGLFYNTGAALPAAKNTPLAAGRQTYYFRTTFEFNGDTVGASLQINPIVDDGAVYYLNGVEVYRQNMPDGSITFSTVAATGVGTAAYAGPISIPAAQLQPGTNVLAVEVHDGPTSVATGGPTITPGAGIALGWDGTDGAYFSATNPALAPNNIARSSSGAVAFGSSQFGGIHLVSNVNNGQYGNSNSWLSNLAAGNQFVGVRFAGMQSVSSFAFGRDNGNTVIDACGGTCTDRSIGTYTVQYTQVATPTSGTAETGNAATGWVTLGTLQYTGASAGFTPYLRHNYIVSQGGNPIQATGLRIKVSDPSLAIDELEVNSPAATTQDAVFGTQLLLRQLVGEPDPPPKLAFNEVAAAGVGFGLELANYGDTSLNLAGWVIGLQRATYSEYVIGAQSLSAGALTSLTQAQLGFTPQAGDKLFLYAPGKTSLVDATQVAAGHRARQTLGTGAWLAPSALTLGAANTFSLHDEVVINEIMYHHRPEQAVSAVVEETPLLALTSTWKYHDSGVDLGNSWQAAGYDDSAWSSGAGLLYVETAALPAPKNTPLASGRNTYYFRQSFQFAGDTNGLELQLNPLVDDGAIFYLNGVEIYRLNMPAGAVTYSTSATAAVGDATLGSPITLPITGLQVGTNVLAVEVHQASTIPPGGGSGPLITPAGGFTIAWDGTDGDYSTPSNPALAPANLALANQGTTAFGSSEYGAGIHLIANVNNGQYGNSNSWLSNFTLPDPNPYIGLKFNGLKSVSSIAFGRDNGNLVDGCGGTCADRSLGTYTVQYTQVANPGTSTTETGNAATGWVTVGTLNYQGATSGFTPHLRHGYQVSQGGNPLQATGLRIKVSDANIAIDELEVNSPVDPGNSDVVFGASLSAVRTLSPAAPFHESSEAWVEIFNRSASAIDISGWKLSDAVAYTFPLGTTLAAGEYLVVAADATALRALYPSPSIRILGNFTGSLSRSSEHVQLTDLAGNPADSVTYFDGGRWPEAADGGGASLELRDPDSDNNRAESWAASNESAHSTWQTYTYTGTVTSDGTTEEYREFILGLLGAGEVLLDDISVIEDPAGANIQRIQNGSFQSGNANTWRIAGNHQGTVVVDPDNAANQVLRLVATGPTEDRANHAETTFVGNAPIQNGLVYQVSFKAKWLSGSNQLNSRFYFNRMPVTTLLVQPSLSGTPGTVNSTALANAGPTYGAVQQSKAIPEANEAVTISVAASDPDGVASLTLWWRAGAGAWQSLSMAAASGVYTQSIPGQAASTVIQFYIEGVDGLGVHSTWPAAGTNARALIKVDDGQSVEGQAHELRLIMTAADSAAMHTPVNQSSNQLLRATVVYDEREVFYNVGVRLQGSPAARADNTYVGFAIEFDPDHLFRGVQSEIRIDRSGRSGPVPFAQDELLVKHIVNQAGGVPETYDDLVHFIAPSATHTRMAILSAGFTNELFDSLYDNGEDGTLYKLDVPYVPNGTTDGNPQSPKIPNPYHHPPVKDLADYGDDKEAYRMHLGISNNRDRDDFTSIIGLSKAMSLNGQALADAVGQYMDVDEWMRTFALQSLTGIADTYTRGGLHHNLNLYTRPSDGKVVAVPYDWDFAFTLPTNEALVGAFSNLNKVINIPSNLRVFRGHLQDIISTTFNTTYMATWTSHYGQVAGQNYSSILNYIGQRAAFVTSQLPAQIPFAITTNAGADFSVTTPSVLIQGKGWINVREIYLAGRTGPLDVTWLDGDSWQATIPLANGVNTLTFNAVNYQGQPAGSDTIQVTTNVGQTTQSALRVSELMYHPGPRTPAEIAAGFTDDDDFEFIELTNVGALPVSLTGVEFTTGITFDFSASSITSLAPGEFVVVASNQAAFSLRYPEATARLAGQYAGQLNNGGEPLVLVDNLDQIIQQFSYLDTWHPSTDGLGRSLVIINPLGTTASWNDAASWRASGSLGGSPGAADLQAASVVGRRVFYNHSKYDSGDAAANSADDAAIATDKSALLPGGVATAANYTNYSRGINGLMVDVSNLGGPLAAADFEFRVGNDNNPAAWPLAVAPLSIDVRSGAGTAGSSRVTIIWPDGAITGKWLQVTVKATAATNLISSDVFYFGNAIGETGDSAGNAIVNSSDEIATRNNGRSFNNPAPLNFAYDFNRDGFVNATDQLLARGKATTLATSLKLIAPPAGLAALADLPSHAVTRGSLEDVAVGIALSASSESTSTGQVNRFEQQAVVATIPPDDARTDVDDREMELACAAAWAAISSDTDAGRSDHFIDAALEDWSLDDDLLSDYSSSPRP